MTDASLQEFRGRLIAHITENDPDNLRKCGVCLKEISDDLWKCVLREPYTGIKLDVEHYLMAHAECTKGLPKGANVAYINGKTTELHTKYSNRSVTSTAASAAAQPVIQLPIEKPIIESCDGNADGYFTYRIKEMIKKKTSFRSKRIRIFAELYLGDALVHKFNSTTGDLDLTFYSGLRMGGGYLDWSEVEKLL